MTSLPPPAVVESQTIIQGGYLENRPWLPEVIVKDGANFITIRSLDINFARFCGQEVTAWNPWKRSVASYFAQLRTLRNDVVDGFIMEKCRENDPQQLADPNAQTACGLEKHRTLMFAKSGVPDVIQVLHPEFTNAGINYPAKILRMMSTARRDPSVVVELTSDTLNYLAAAALGHRARRAKRQRLAICAGVNPEDYIQDKARVRWKRGPGYLWGYTAIR